MISYFNKWLLAGALFAVTTAVEASPVKTRYSTVELLSEVATLPQDGGIVSLGFSVTPDAGWHAYWKNPGDAGMAPSVDWMLAEGFSAGPFAFPTPHVLPFGELITYAYEEPVLLLTELTVPAGLRPGTRVEIAGNAQWVVCDDRICVPESTSLELSLTIGDGQADEKTAARFAEARNKLPEEKSWPAQFASAGDDIVFKLTAELAGSRDHYLFVEAGRLVEYARQSATLTPDGIEVVMTAGRGEAEIDATPAVLAYTDADGTARASALTIGRTDSAAGASVSEAPAAVAGNTLDFGRAALFAFLGGIILNLMPCVFPILSMKALSLVNLAGQQQSVARASGVLYTLGILLAFAVIAAILLAIRSAGEAVGWGFQMQHPLVNVCLGLLMVFIAMNLAGSFEIGTRVVGVGQGLTEGGERKKAFFTGLLAVIVATPCTAPFMAGALGYALAQPAALSMAIFMALGFGLAFPYLLLSFVPALGRWLPKPGAWMETFKHLLAFPMLLTAVWLFWIVGRQLGATAMAIALAAAVALAFALWAYGHAGRATTRKAGWYLTALAGLIACGYAVAQVDKNKSIERAADDRSAGTLGGLSLERFDPERVVQYVADGQPTFVYFTADWCISCKANEKVALSTDAVAEAMNSRGIKVVEGDWTTQDPVITEWLQRYNRVGVPLYLYFPAGSSLDTVTILPQILTPGIVIDAIDSADAAAGSLTAAEAAPFVLPESAPDWQIVEDYLERDAEWHAAEKDVRGEHPDVIPARAAATAIVNESDGHPRSADAAAFLVREVVGSPEWPDALRLGFETLVEKHPDFDDWPSVLFSADFYTEPGDDDWADRIFEDFEFMVTEQPVAAATARYYAASRQLRLANAVDTDPADRERHRVRAIDLATGLSRGVEDAKLVKRRRFTDDGEPIPFPSLAEAEEDLLYNLEFLTVGSPIPEVRAARLDGVVENISVYRGQAVLLDFWATWCGPCIDALPKLNALDQALPEGEFEILSISVDEKVSTVTDFREERPMPWSHWHVGPRGELLRSWAVRGYPTYLLIDHDGRIVARQHDLNADFLDLIRSTACGPTGGQTC